jgi:hypothetical protein
MNQESLAFSDGSVNPMGNDLKTLRPSLRNATKRYRNAIALLPDYGNWALTRQSSDINEGRRQKAEGSPDEKIFTTRDERGFSPYTLPPTPYTLPPTPHTLPSRETF